MIAEEKDLATQYRNDALHRSQKIMTDLIKTGSEQTTSIAVVLAPYEDLSMDVRQRQDLKPSKKTEILEILQGAYAYQKDKLASSIGIKIDEDLNRDPRFLGLSPQEEWNARLVESETIRTAGTAAIFAEKAMRTAGSCLTDEATIGYMSLSTPIL